MHVNDGKLESLDLKLHIFWVMLWELKIIYIEDAKVK